MPQFYLREFLDTRVIVPEQPYVWVYDKEECKLKKKATNNIAFKNGFYDMTLIDGNVTPFIEDFFAEVESSSAPIYRKVISQIPITDDEREMFSNFLYFTLARVPNFLNYMSWFYKNGDTINEKGSNNFMEEQPMQHDVEAIMEEGMQLIPEGLSTLEFMIEMSQIFAPIISKMTWQFAIAPKGKLFVTSDNPLILNDPSSKKITSTFAGWTNPNIHLTFPITPGLCMFATWDKKKNTYFNADLRFMKAVNFRTSFFATRFIFSSRPITPPPISGIFNYNIFDTYDNRQ